MARTGRPKFKPTAPQRNRVKLMRADGWSKERIARQIGVDADTLVKHFAEELEYGADQKRLELIEAAEKGAKKGNASLIKWLTDRHDAARAAHQLEERGRPSAEPVAPAPVPPKGKKEQRQEAANKVTGKYATPPSPPVKLH